jgi:hypothetical protein
MSVTLREFTDAKNDSIVAFCTLLVFFGLVFSEFGIYISLLALAIYLVFNLKWLYSTYFLYSKETKHNSSTPKKVILANFIPFVCFYQPYYHIIELLRFAGRNTFPAYFVWVSQLISLVFAVFKAFGDQDFSFLYYIGFVWLGFSFYLYQGVNRRIESLVK